MNEQQQPNYRGPMSHRIMAEKWARYVEMGCVPEGQDMEGHRATFYAGAIALFFEMRRRVATEPSPEATVLRDIEAELIEFKDEAEARAFARAEAQACPCLACQFVRQLRKVAKPDPSGPSGPS